MEESEVVDGNTGHDPLCHVDVVLAVVDGETKALERLEVAL
jgi:hypothetical protein